MKWIIFPLLFVLGSCALEKNQSVVQSTVNQPTSSARQELKFTSGIRSVLEDSKGNVWFGSHQEGACVYDGKSFRYFEKDDGLSDNQVRNIYEDTSGTIWFECGNGISYYQNGQINILNNKNYSQKIKWDKEEEDLWFKADPSVGFNQTEEYPGVYRYDGSTFYYSIFPVQLLPGMENYYSVTTPFVKGPSGTIWWGTYGAAIGFHGRDFTVLDNERLGLTEKTGFLHIRSVFEDSKGNLWIGNNGIGVFKFNGTNIEYITQQYKLDKQENESKTLLKVFSIGEDSKGNIWFGTNDEGAWCFNGKGFKNYGASEGLQSQHVWSIYTSKSGKLWFLGASPSGVYQLEAGTFSKIY